MISNESPLLDGWISQEECDLVLKYMKLDTGTILETGSAIGRLFDYLYPKKPNWKYVSVDKYANCFENVIFKYSLGSKILSKAVEDNVNFEISLPGIK